MSLLTICQNAADEINILRPASIAGNTDPTAQRLFRLVNKIGITLMKAAQWQDLRKEATFTAAATEAQTGIIPADFDRFVRETFWDRTNQSILTGPVSPQEWSGLKAQNYSDTARRKFTDRAGSILMIPTPSGNESMAFEYISNQWCQSSGGTGQSAFAADTDTGVLDEELLTLGLIFEEYQALGQAGHAQAAYSTYTDRLADLLENEQADPGVMSAGDIFGGRHYTGSPYVSGSNLNAI